MLPLSLNMKTLSLKCILPTLVVCICFSFKVSYADSACACTPYLSFGFGFEYIAKTCPQEGDTVDTEREYEWTDLKCVGNVLSTSQIHYPIDAVEGNGNRLFTKAGILAFASRDGNYTKLFVNESGTHVIAMHKDISGYTVEGISAAVGTKEDKVFNKYCAHDAGLPDTDQDGYPDCLDCMPNDNDNNGKCIYNEKNLGGGPPC